MLTRSRWLWGGAVAVAALLALSQAPWRGLRSWQDAGVSRPDLEASALGEDAMRAAREALLGGDPDLGELADVEVLGAHLCVVTQPGDVRCAYGAGPTLDVALDAGAEPLAGGAPAQRVAVDLVTVVEPWRPDRDTLADADAGLWGFRRGDAAVLPWEVLALGVYGGPEGDRGYDLEALWRLLASRGAPAGPPQPRERVERFRTVQWVDSRAGPMRMVRLHGAQPPQVDPESLARRAVWAADHLASTVSPDGRIRYLYEVGHGREARGYNLLRHGGSTYSLLQAYEAFGHEPWLRASEAALGYLLASSVVDTRSGPYGGGTTRWIRESSYIKLGGAGLALVAFATHMRVTGDRAHLEEARQFARYIVSQQQSSGEFVYFANIEPGGPARDRTSAYYPGEAILGLMMLYELDPDPLWLATARRGADWLIDVRDAGKGPRDLENDHWLMIALHELVRHAPDPRYVTHSLALAAAVQHQLARYAGREQQYPDFAGGVYAPPRSTPAATRAEGLVAVLDTCAWAERSCDHLHPSLDALLTHLSWSQYTADTAWWMRHPERVIGGVAGGVVDPDLRNDFTQHSLSAWIGALRLRSPARGRAMLAPALEEVRAVRGLHRWDEGRP